MDELEMAVKEYLKTKIGGGNIVTIKKLRNDVVPGFLSRGNLLSDILDGIRRFIRRLANEKILQRVRPGVYLYWPDGRPKIEQANRIPLVERLRTVDLSPIPRGSDISVLSPVAPRNIPLPFDSVASLSLSDEFLIQRSLAEVDLEALQGLSF